MQEHAKLSMLRRGAGMQKSGLDLQRQQCLLVVEGSNKGSRCVPATQKLLLSLINNCMQTMNCLGR